MGESSEVKRGPGSCPMNASGTGLVWSKRGNKGQSAEGKGKNRYRVRRGGKCRSGRISKAWAIPTGCRAWSVKGRTAASKEACQSGERNGRPPIRVLVLGQGPGLEPDKKWPRATGENETICGVA